MRGPTAHPYSQVNSTGAASAEAAPTWLETVAIRPRRRSDQGRAAVHPPGPGAAVFAMLSAVRDGGDPARTTGFADRIKTGAPPDPSHRLATGATDLPRRLSRWAIPGGIPR